MTNEPRRNVYVGHRYVPKIMDEWDKSISYEGLSIVTYQGGSYTSKKYVPKGIDINNTEYWTMTGNYNAQVEHYRQEVKGVKEDLIHVENEIVKKADLDYVDNEIAEINDILGKTVTKLSDFPMITSEELDDTERFKRSINHAKENGNQLIIDESITISSTIMIPDNIFIIGKNSPVITVKVNDSTGLLISGSNVDLLGIEIDGVDVTRVGIEIAEESKNISIKNCSIKNLYSKTKGSYGIHVKNSQNVTIENTYFENIKSEEDGIIGNGLGSARGILFSNIINGVAKLNEFNKIGGFEDGDSIHVQSNITNGSCLIEGNLFRNVTKRAVKLQAPNNIVRDNLIFSEYVGSEDTPTGVISDYDNNNEISNNKINLLRAMCALHLSGCQSSNVIDNYIEVDKTGTYYNQLTRGSQISNILISDARDVNIENNELVGMGRKIYRCINSKNISVVNNLFKEGKGLYILADGFNGLYIKDNVFQSSEITYPNDMIRLDDSDNVLISNNEFGTCTIPVRFHGSAKDVNILPNVFLKILSNSRYRTSEVNSDDIENIKIIGDYETGTARIETGETEVTVNYNLGRQARAIVVTPAQNIDGSFSVRRGGETGFTIVISEPQSRIISFFWLAD